MNYKEKSVFTDVIDKKLDMLKGRVKTYKDITDLINSEFKTEFVDSQIKYRVKKLIEKNLGSPDDDAYEFVKLAQEDAKNGGGYFSYETDTNNRFKRCLYLSQTMLTYSKKFLDSVIIDATYKRNRFNLILVNIIGVSNHGRNIMLAFSLLTDETKESYKWLFSELYKAWNKSDPTNFICNEDEAIISGKIS